MHMKLKRMKRTTTYYQKYTLPLMLTDFSMLTMNIQLDKYKFQNSVLNIVTCVVGTHRNSRIEGISICTDNIYVFNERVF